MGAYGWNCYGPVKNHNLNSFTVKFYFQTEVVCDLKMLAKLFLVPELIMMLIGGFTLHQKRKENCRHFAPYLMEGICLGLRILPSDSQKGLLMVYCNRLINCTGFYMLKFRKGRNRPDIYKKKIVLYSAARVHVHRNGPSFLEQNWLTILFLSE